MFCPNARSFSAVLLCFYLTVSGASSELLFRSRVIYPRVLSEKERTDCQTKSGGDGICKNIENCESALAAISTSHPKICYFEKNLPVVCCPVEDDVQPITTQIPDEMESDEGCGKKTVIHMKKKLDRRQKQTTDETDESYSWPWLVAITKFSLVGTSEFLCAGTLINPRFILTAANCFDEVDGPLQPSRYEVLLGLYTKFEGTPYGVERVIVHEDYSARTGYNDIALLKLSEDVDYNDQVDRVCLPTNDTLKPIDNAIINRATAPSVSEDIGSSTFEEVEIPIVSNGACNHSIYGRDADHFREGILSSQICADFPQDGANNCQESSRGGSLVVSDDDNRWQIVGVLSSSAGCADEGLPGVYTRVSSYLPWIKEHSKTSATAQLRELYRNFILQRSRKQKAQMLLK